MSQGPIAEAALGRRTEALDESASLATPLTMGRLAGRDQSALVMRQIAEAFDVGPERSVSRPMFLGGLRRAGQRGGRTHKGGVGRYSCPPMSVRQLELAPGGGGCWVLAPAAFYPVPGDESLARDLPRGAVGRCLWSRTAPVALPS